LWPILCNILVLISKGLQNAVKWFRGPADRGGRRTIHLFPLEWTPWPLSPIALSVTLTNVPPSSDALGPLGRVVLLGMGVGLLRRGHPFSFFFLGSAPQALLGTPLPQKRVGQLGRRSGCLTNKRWRPTSYNRLSGD